MQNGNSQHDCQELQMRNLKLKTCTLSNNTTLTDLLFLRASANCEASASPMLCPQQCSLIRVKGEEKGSGTVRVRAF